MDREAGEPLNKFMKRFMKSKPDKKKWPSQKPRLALGYAEAKEHSKR
jgi:hypothetical protein